MRVIAIALTAMAVCTSAAAEPVRDVAYYLANPKERGAKLAQCYNNPGQLGRTANCINASTAERRHNAQQVINKPYTGKRY